MVKRLHFFLIVNFMLITPAHAGEWPVDNNASVTANYGVYEHGWHDALDIPGQGNSSKCVAVAEMKLIHIETQNQAINIDFEIVSTGKFVGYTHILPLPNTDPDFVDLFATDATGNFTTVLQAGQRFAYVAPKALALTSFDHVHFQTYDIRGDWHASAQNPLQSSLLSTNDPADNVPVIGVLYIRRNGAYLEKSTSPYLWGRNEIIAQITDNQGSQSNTPGDQADGDAWNGSENQFHGTISTAYRVKFSIDGQGSTGRPEQSYEFSGHPDDAAMDRIYDRIKDINANSDPNGYFLAKNFIFRLTSLQTDGTWNTLAPAAGDPLNENDKAFLSILSHYPDGKYTLKISGEDIAGHVGTRNENVVVDNFPPYVQKVTVSPASAPNSPKYSADWPGAQDENNLSGGLNTPSPNDLMGVAAPLKFTVEFSEEMDPQATHYLALEFPNSTPISFQGGTWSNNNSQLDISVSPSSLQNVATSGAVQVVVQGTDLAGNAVDANPQTIAHRDANGSFVNYDVGADRNHILKIAAQPKLVSVSPDNFAFVVNPPPPAPVVSTLITLTFSDPVKNGTVTIGGVPVSVSPSTASVTKTFTLPPAVIPAACGERTAKVVVSGFKDIINQLAPPDATHSVHISNTIASRYDIDHTSLIVGGQPSTANITISSCDDVHVILTAQDFPVRWSIDLGHTGPNAINVVKSFTPGDVHKGYTFSGITVQGDRAPLFAVGGGGGTELHSSHEGLRGNLLSPPGPHCLPTSSPRVPQTAPPVTISSLNVPAGLQLSLDGTITSVSRTYSLNYSECHLSSSLPTIVTTSFSPALLNGSYTAFSSPSSTGKMFGGGTIYIENVVDGIKVPFGGWSGSISADPTFIQSAAGESIAVPAAATETVGKLVARISTPRPGNLVRANVPVIGLAMGDSFARYVLEYGKGENPDQWTLIQSDTSTRTEDVIPQNLVFGDASLFGSLGTFHSGLIEYSYPFDTYARDLGIDGPYTLRLRVFDTVGIYAEDSVLVRVGRVVGQTFNATARTEDGRVAIDVPGLGLGVPFQVVAIETATPPVPLPEGATARSQVYRVYPGGIPLGASATVRIVPDVLTDSTAIFVFDPSSSSWRQLPRVISADHVGGTLEGLTPDPTFIVALETPAFIAPNLSSPANSIVSATHPALFHASFDGSAEGVASRSLGTVLTTTDSGLGSGGALRAEYTDTRVPFVLTLFDKGYDAADFSHLRFAIRRPAINPAVAAQVNLFVRQGNDWGEVTLFDPIDATANGNIIRDEATSGVTNLGKIDPTAADMDGWTLISLNLRNLLLEHGKSTKIDELVLGDLDWQGYRALGPSQTPVGTTFYLDDVAVYKPGSHTFQATLKSTESVTGFRYVVEDEAGTLGAVSANSLSSEIGPDGNLTVELPQGRFILTAAATDGDSVGPMMRFPIISDIEPPVVTSYRSGDVSIFAPIAVTIRDSGVKPWENSGIPTASLDFRINGESFALNHPAIQYNPVSGELIFQPAHSSLHGRFAYDQQLEVTVSASDDAGNMMTPFSWTVVYRNAKIRIDEVKTGQGHGGKWAELSTEGPVDLHDVLISDLEHSREPLSPIAREYFTAPARMLVHFTNGQSELGVDYDVDSSGFRDIFVEKTRLTRTDECVLYASGIETPLEAVAWRDTITVTKRSDVALLQTMGVWSGPPVVLFRYHDNSISRLTPIDHDDASDWEEGPTTPGQPLRYRAADFVGALRISELQVAEPGGPWVEVEALRGPLDVSNVTVSTLDAEDSRISSTPLTLNSGDRIVLRWQSIGRTEVDAVGDANHNGIRDVFMKSGFPNREADEVLLRWDSVVIDAVTWGTVNKMSNDSKAFDALGVWQGAPALPPRLFHSIGRTEGQPDRNAAIDWSLQIKPTPGFPNAPNVPPPAGAIVINELSPDRSVFGHDWAELLVREGTWDLGVLRLTDLDGIDPPLSPGRQITLSAGSRAVVHWAPGITETDESGDVNQNGYRDIYISGQAPFITNHQLVLFAGAEIVDAVRWSGKSFHSKRSLHDAQTLAASGAWRGDVAPTGAVDLTYRTIGRLPDGTDNDIKSDWGPSLPTPGFPNLSPEQDSLPPVPAIFISNSVESGNVAILTASSNILLTATDSNDLKPVSFFRLDGNGFYVFADRFPLLIEGPHELEFYAEDFFGNRSDTRIKHLYLDVTPPSIRIETNRGNLVDSALPGETLTISAEDSILPVRSLNVRLFADGVVIDSVNSTGRPIHIRAPHDSGIDTVSVIAYDLLSNRRIEDRTFSVTVPDDILPTRTTLSIGTPLAQGSPDGSAPGDTFVSTATSFTLSAVDDLLVEDDSVGLGVARTVYSTDNGPENTYASPFMLAGYVDGAHSVRYNSIDVANNVETSHVIAIRLDQTAPEISVSVGAPRVDRSGRIYITASTPIIASAIDRGVGLESFTQPFLPLASGANTLTYRATDRLGNASETTLVVTVDNFAPGISITSPQPGDTFIAKRDSVVIAFTVIDNFDPAPTVTAYLVDLEESTIFQVQNGMRIEPLAIDDGQWQLVVNAQDWLGNVSQVVSGSFTVIHDIQPPRTTASVGTPRATGSATGAAPGETFVTSATLTTFSAIDDLVTVGDNIGLGVARTEFRIGADSFQTGTILSLSGSDGPRVVGYRSIDVIGNTEAERQFTLYLDNTSPTTETSVGAPQYQDSRGLFLTFATPIIFADSDVGVGIAGESVTTVHASGSGVETLTHMDTDLLGHATTTTVAVIVDNAPPATSFAIGNPKFVSGGTFITSSSTISFTADDASGAGVSRIEVALDNDNFTTYITPITFATEGAHSIQYRSIDRLGTVETVRTLSVTVDNSAPITNLTPGTPQATVDSKFYVTSATPFTLTAIDQPADGSGVEATRYRIDTGSLIIGTSFTISGADGSHAVVYSSMDNLGNAEAERTTIVQLDNTPPTVSVTVGQPKYTDNQERVFGTSATTIILVATDSGSGVASFEASIDNGAYAPYSAAITLPTEGQHVVAWRAVDRVGGTTTGQTRLIIDNTAPLTSLAISPTDTAGHVLIPESLVTLAPTDLGAIPVGVATTEWRFDTNVYQQYSSPFEVGRIGFASHTLTYRSADHVGNTAETTFVFRLSPALEATKSRSFAPRTLVWWNYDFAKAGTTHKDAPPLAPNRERIERAVRDESLLFDTVTTPESFVAGMHSDRYNVFVILGNKRQLENQEENDLAERVNLGAGVIASIFDEIRGPKLAHDNDEGEHANARDNVLGVKVDGKFSDGSARVQILAGVLTDTAYTIKISEKSSRIKEFVGESIAIYLDIETNEYAEDHNGEDGDHHGNNGNGGGNDSHGEGNGGHGDSNHQNDNENPISPAAATRNTYGLGDAIFFAFDLAKLADNVRGETIVTLMRRAMQSVAPDTEPAIAGGVTAIEIRVKSLVVPLDLAVSIEELVPSDVNIRTIVPPATLSGGALVWTVILDAGEETRVSYEAVLPNQNAAIQTEAIVSYLIRGTYREFGRLNLTITAQEAATSLETARDRINAIIQRVSQHAGDRSRAEQALSTVDHLLAHPPTTPGDRATAVENLINAIEKLTRIEESSAQSDIKAARRAMGQAIIAYELLGLPPRGGEDGNHNHP